MTDENPLTPEGDDLPEQMRVRPPAAPPAVVRRGDSVAGAGLQRQIARRDAFADHLDPDGLAAFPRSRAASVPGAVDALFTLTSLIDDVAAGG